MSAVTALGFPAATMRMSALLVWKPCLLCRCGRWLPLHWPLSVFVRGYWRWVSDDVRSSHDDDLCTVNLCAGPNQKPLDPCWRAGKIIRLTDHQFSHIDRMEPIHILFRIDGVEDFGFIDVLGQWKLNQNAVDLGISLILID